MTQTPIPLVFLPGFMLDESLWDEVVERLGPHAPTVCLRLEPGASTEEIADGIANAAPPRFVLVGFSLGGYLARKVAERHPQRVAALVLVATSLRVDSAAREKSKRDAVTSMRADSFRGLGSGSIAKSLHPSRRDDKALIARIKRMGERLGYAALVTQTQLRRDQIAASTLRCPTLVIAAADDALRSAEETQELAEAIPNASLRVIGNSGHMLPLEQPGALADMIKQWLAALGPL
ncbi:MAG: alpha/beta hydrolase [Pigmentiphaga sp.]